MKKKALLMLVFLSLLAGTGTAANNTTVSAPVHVVDISGIDLPGNETVKPSASSVQRIVFTSTYPIQDASFRMEIYDEPLEEMETYRTFKVEKSHSSLSAEIEFNISESWLGSPDHEPVLYYSSRDWSKVHLSGNGSLYTATIDKTGFYALSYEDRAVDEPANTTNSSTNRTGSADELTGEDEEKLPYFMILLAAVIGGSVIGVVLYYRRMEKMRELAELSLVVKEGLKKGVIPEDSRTRDIIVQAQKAIQQGNLEEANRDLNSLKERITR